MNVTEFGQLALRCGPSVAPSTLVSIARTESGFEPLSIHDNTTGTSGAPATRDSAIQIAAKLLGAGHSVDIGIMQINSANFQRLGLTLEAAFDACNSITAGAAVLAGAYTGGDTHEGRQSALRAALSRYNTGDAQRGFTNGYVHKVEQSARQIVPALDVGVPPATTVKQPPVVPAPIVPADPNAPPSWEVWASFDYAAARHPDTLASASSKPGQAAAKFSASGDPLPAAAPASGSTLER